MNTLRHAITILAAVTIAVTVRGVSPEQLQQRELPIAAQSKEVFSLNPAAKWWVDSIAISSASVDYRFEQADRPAMAQLGSGHNLYSISARSYLPMKGDYKVWGEAEFRAGQIRDVRWADVVDYQFIAPYVLGDAVGGDLATQRYDFGGGIARKSGSWTFGGEIAYRAEIAHRSVDPRIKTIVSDLDLKVGVAHTIGSRYLLGLDLAAKIYAQNCDLDFYNPINDINTYTLTGLGTYYQRFMGNTNKNSGYSARGWSAGVQLVPVGEEGIEARVSIESYRAEQQLRNFNNITLGFTDNLHLAARAGYRLNIQSVRILPTLTADYWSRRGKENLFGTSAGASYDKIGTRRPYSHRRAGVSIEVPVEIRLGLNYLTISPSATYLTDNEKVVAPLRNLRYAQLNPGLNADYSLRIGDRWLIDIGAGYTRVNGSVKTRVLSDLDLASSLGQLVVDNFEMAVSDANRFGCNLRLSRDLGGKILTANLRGAVVRYANSATTRSVIASLSLIF